LEARELQTKGLRAALALELIAPAEVAVVLVLLVQTVTLVQHPLKLEALVAMG
jgi:hypothetical protein